MDLRSVPYFVPPIEVTSTSSAPSYSSTLRIIMLKEDFQTGIPQVE